MIITKPISLAIKPQLQYKLWITQTHTSKST